MPPHLRPSPAPVRLSAAGDEAIKPAAGTGSHGKTAGEKGKAGTVPVAARETRRDR